MRLHATTGAETRVFRASVVGSVAYGTLFAVFVIWVFCTLRVDTFASLVLDPVFLGFSFFAIASAIDVLWFLLLLADLGPARRASRGLRRAHAGGVALSLLLVLGVQAVLFAMRDLALDWRVG